MSHLQANMSSLEEWNFLAVKGQQELVSLGCGIAYIRDALQHIDGRGLGSGLLQPKTRKFNHRTGSNAHRSAVFEFDFSIAVIARPELGALDHGQVQDSSFKALAAAAIDLDVALDVAEAHDPGLRIRLCGDRPQRNRKCYYNEDQPDFVFHDCHLSLRDCPL